MINPESSFREERVVSPSIYQFDNFVIMAYTGVNDDLIGQISIALAQEYWIQADKQLMLFQISGESKPVSIYNLGLMDIEITDISISGEGFSIDPVTTPLNLSIKNKAILNVTFTGSDANDYSAKLTVQSNDPIHPELTIDLQGPMNNQ